MFQSITYGWWHGPDSWEAGRYRSFAVSCYWWWCIFRVLEERGGQDLILLQTASLPIITDIINVFPGCNRERERFLLSLGTDIFSSDTSQMVEPCCSTRVRRKTLSSDILKVLWVFLNNLGVMSTSFWSGHLEIAPWQYLGFHKFHTKTYF